MYVTIIFPLQITLSCEEADCEDLEQFVILGSNVSSVTLEVTEVCETSYTATALGGIEVHGAYMRTGKVILCINVRPCTWCMFEVL